MVIFKKSYIFRCLKSNVMKVLKVLIGLLLLLVLGALVMYLVAKGKPTELKIEREITINKPVEEVYEFARFVGNMDKVSVWQSIDPDMKTSTSGTDGSVGFISSWESDHKKVGVGEQEIVNLTPNERVDLKLRFKNPDSEGDAYLITEAVDSMTTTVKWGFASEFPVPFNLLMPSIEKEIIENFDQGLQNLKTELE